MDPEDHKLTDSYGSSAESVAYREQQKLLIEQGKFDDAFLMDVNDIQSLFGNKYDDAIWDAIDAIPDHLNRGY